MEIILTAYCQILKKNITAEKCAEIQGQDNCFGCAAPSRLCVSCKQRPIKVPAVGLCSQCLALQLAQEIKEGRPALNSLLCEKCKERPVRFRQYGLCLSCSVAEFGEEHQLQSESADIITNDHSTATNNDFTKEKPTEKQNKEREVNEMNKPATLCSTCHKNPAYVKGLCRRCYMAQYKESLKKTKTDKIAALIIDAKELILSTQTFSKDLLRKKLKIGCQLGDIITEELEKEGVIRQINSGAHRLWKLNAPDIPQKSEKIKKTIISAPASTLDKKIEKLQALAKAIGPDSELTETLEDAIKYLPIIEQIKKLG